MSILHVANMGQPVLRREAPPVDPGELQDPAFQSFLDDLVRSMQFHDGVGLAAPQVFRSQRVVAVEVPAELDDERHGLPPDVYINPEIKVSDETLVDGWEGCLSLKDLRGMVPRYKRIVLHALDRHGKNIERILSGYTARVFQHEVDHLDGILFVDRMEDMATLMFSKELEMLARAEAEHSEEHG